MLYDIGNSFIHFLELDLKRRKDYADTVDEKELIQHIIDLIEEETKIKWNI